MRPRFHGRVLSGQSAQSPWWPWGVAATLSSTANRIRTRFMPGIALLLVLRLAHQRESNLHDLSSRPGFQFPAFRTAAVESKSRRYGARRRTFQSASDHHLATALMPFRVSVQSFRIISPSSSRSVVRRSISARAPASARPLANASFSISATCSASSLMPNVMPPTPTSSRS